jgi:hypothetical protein
MTTDRGPSVQLHLYARQTIVPIILHDDSITRQRDRRPLTYPLDQADRWIEAERTSVTLSVLSREMGRSHQRAIWSLCVEMSTSAPCAAWSARMSMTRSALTWSRAEVQSAGAGARTGRRRGLAGGSGPPPGPPLTTPAR